MIKVKCRRLKTKYAKTNLGKEKRQLVDHRLDRRQYWISGLYISFIYKAHQFNDLLHPGFRGLRRGQFQPLVGIMGYTGCLSGRGSLRSHIIGFGVKRLESVDQQVPQFDAVWDFFYRFSVFALSHLHRIVCIENCLPMVFIICVIDHCSFDHRDYQT